MAPRKGLTTALFLMDLLLNSLMIVLALRMDGRWILPGRVIASAAMGACAAQWARLSSLTRLQAAALWLPTAMLMMVIAGGRQTSRHPLRSALVLLCAGGLLGGIIQALHGATGSLAAAYALGCLAAAAVAVSALRARRAACSRMHVKVMLHYRGREASFDGIVDSGNTLRDYLMHLPVIVLPQEDARARLGLENVPLRPIFADTAGGRRMMDCFVPESVTIACGKSRRAVRASVALSPGMQRGMSALVPAALVSGDES